MCMDYKTFSSYIEDNIEDYLDRAAVVSIQVLPDIKNNGVVEETLVIRTKDNPQCPVICLTPYYDAYTKGTDKACILAEIADDYFKGVYQPYTVPLGHLMDFEAVREDIFIRAVNYERNKDMLAICPHVRKMDLALTFRVRFYQGSDGLSSLLVDYRMMGHWDISEEFLYEYAMKNTTAKFPPVIESSEDIYTGLMLDLVANVTDDPENGDFYIVSKIEELEDFEGKLVKGRMPENDREAVLFFPEGGYAENVIDMAYGKEAMLTDQNTGSDLMKDKVKIVGYGLLDDRQTEAMEEGGYYLEAYLCINEEGMSDVRMAALERYCTQEIHFAGHILDGNSASGMMPIRASENVPEGEIYVSEDIAALAQGSAAGSELSIVNKSLYFEDRFTFEVGAVYNKDNLKQYLNLDDFEAVSGTLFISPKDYSRMFEKGNFQSSVIVSDDKITAQTAESIAEAGYETFVVNDGVVSYAEGFDVILNTFRTIMLAAVLIVLFFITYFITKLILKSRNVYFSTIRMLGATKENCSGLLKTELFTVFNIAFFICLGFFLLVKSGNINSEYLTQLASFLGAGDFVLLYIVLCLMSILLAARYARQLFKKTAMNAYKEEV